MTGRLDNGRVASSTPLPQDFLWGVSSSGFQSEGGAFDSDWMRHNAADPKQDRYGTSVDFRHRYREDVGLAADLGVNVFRIGVNWALLEPRPGQVDEAAQAYYDDLIAALLEAGLAPLITLDHFDFPGWVTDQGGWLNPKTCADFVAYSNRIVSRYPQVRLWITFNEAFASIAGQKARQKLSWKQFGQVRDHMVCAHRQVYDLIHATVAGAMVTTNVVWMGDRRGAGLMNRWSNSQFLDRVLDKCDVVAFDYYNSDLLNGLNAVLKNANWLWRPDPAGLYRALKILQRRYPDKPILIAETGMATEDGKPRADGVLREDVLRDSVYWTQRARAEGVNVIGYMLWTLTDNFEWGSYSPRFGLYTVNVLTDPTLKRIPTAAVAVYRDIIRARGVDAGHQPVVGR
jgi:beta-glucosidase